MAYTPAAVERAMKVQETILRALFRHRSSLSRRRTGGGALSSVGRATRRPA
jgi:hypothetical protein